MACFSSLYLQSAETERREKLFKIEMKMKSSRFFAHTSLHDKKVPPSKNKRKEAKKTC